MYQKLNCLVFATLAVLACTAIPTASAALTINELMAGGQDVFADEDGDYPDWIELYNSGPEPVNLQGYHLTDDPGTLARWTFPAVTLAPDAYLVVFASGKNRAVAGAHLHTNFSLDGDGEYLALVAPDGETVVDACAPEFPAQPADCSWGVGRQGAGAAPWIARGAEAKMFLPLTALPSGNWTGGAEPYNDYVVNGWNPAYCGIGYDATTGGALQSLTPLAYWNFENDVNDQSGHGHHGELHGAGYTAAQPAVLGPGRCLTFDGLNDYVGVPIDIPETAGTVSLWFRTAQDGRGIYAVTEQNLGGGNDRNLFLWGGNVAARVYSDELIKSSGKAVADGQWHHLAHVFGASAGGQRLYLDGQLVASGAKASSDFTWQEYVMLGFSTDGVNYAEGSEYFKGDLDEIAIWGEALSAAQVQQLAQGASPMSMAGYLAHIGTDVQAAMRGKATNACLRIPFTVSGATQFDQMPLRLHYDDGIIAWLNGIEIFRRGAPAAVTRTSTATADQPRAAALAGEAIDLTPYAHLLRQGRNILALQGFNAAISDPEFLVAAELNPVNIQPAVYFETPTPGRANGGGVAGFTAAPRFTPARGFQDAPFALEMACDTPGAAIYYTTDRSTPGPGNEAARLYDGPTTITSTATVRAVALRDGFKPSAVVTRTYIFPAAVAAQPSNPPGLPLKWSDNWPADYAMDPRVNSTTLPGYGVREALLDIPTISVNCAPGLLFGSQAGVYFHTEIKGLEQPAAVELIWPDGRQGFQVDAGIRAHGASSQFHAYTGKHSLRLLFKKRYGPGELEYPLFGDSKVDRFDQLVLHACSSDSWAYPDGGSRWVRANATYLRDQWMRDTQLDMGWASAHSRYVHLYLDGLYWGIYVLTERLGDDWCAEHLGGDKAEFDVIKDYAELSAGDKLAWNAAKALAAQGLESDEAYQRIQGCNPDGTPNPAYPRYIDVDSLIDYMIIHIFAAAEDWPNHNWWTGRRRGNPSEGFQWFVWDQENCLDSLTRTVSLFGQRFEEVSAPDSPAYFYDRLRRNRSFQRRFGDRVQTAMFHGGPLTPDACRTRWARRAAEIDHAIVGESARWGDEAQTPRAASDWGARTQPYKREVEWLAVKQWLDGTYWVQEHPIALARFRRVGLFPQAEAPSFSIDGQPRHGGGIAAPAQLTIAAPAGQIYYTLDGSDPRLPYRDASVPATLIPFGAAKRVLIPRSTPAEAWRGGAAFGDSAWLSGSGGIGYEKNSGFESLIGIDVAAMFGGTASCYARIPFAVQPIPSTFNRLTLRIRYDDGFVAWLNGVKVAEANAPASLEWYSAATVDRPDNEAMSDQAFDLSAFIPQLKADNILAIHGLNKSATSSDFLISCELEAAREVATEELVAPGATLYSGPVTLGEGTRVRAAALVGHEWSALTDAFFQTAELGEAIRISEVMYNPPGGGDYEFIELTNGGAAPVDPRTLAFTSGISFSFANSAVASLGAGQQVLVVKNRNAFVNRYGAAGMPIAGEYSGSLDNAGEKIALSETEVGAPARVLIEFEYDNGRGWPVAADGAGHSLVPLESVGERQANGALDWCGHWRASAQRLGSPGAPDPEPPAGAVINEIAANTTLDEPAHPDYDSNDWIELHNPTGSPVTLNDCWLSDDPAELNKWKIPQGTTIAAGACVGFDELTAFHSPLSAGFGLNKDGEQVLLSELPAGAPGRVIDVVRFKAQEPGVAWARWREGEPWWLAAPPTRAAANAEPSPDLRIREIMYHPEATAANPDDNTADEYLELVNAGDQPIHCWNAAGTWRLNGEVEFDFPAGVRVASGGTLLLVPFNPADAAARAAFEQAYGLPAGQQYLGPWSGDLSNRVGRLAIERPLPGESAADLPSWVIVDEATYFDRAPWPESPDGGGGAREGAALHRSLLSRSGNDPSNWAAGTPTPRGPQLGAADWLLYGE